MTLGGTAPAPVAQRTTVKKPPRHPPEKKPPRTASPPTRPKIAAPVRPRPARRKGRRKGLRGVRFFRGPDGHQWMRMSVNQRQRFSFLPGLGYAFGTAGKQLNHLLVQAAIGATLYGRWNMYTSRTRLSRITGHGAAAHVGAELGIRLHKEAAPTHLTFPLRLQQSFAFGRHALMFVASAGPRWDLYPLPMQVGLQVTMGIGYTLILPPAGIPLLIEAVHQSHGAYDKGTWGLRIMMAWPLTY